MTLQVTLLIDDKFVAQGWSNARQLKTLLTALSAQANPRGVPQKLLGRGAPLEPSWTLFDRVGRGLSQRDLDGVVAGHDIHFIREHLGGYRFLPLGRWGAFVELPQVLSRVCASLAKSIRGRGSPRGSFGVWMSYLPGSRRTAPMRLVTHTTPDELVDSVGEPNVVHTTSLPAVPTNSPSS